MRGVNDEVFLLLICFFTGNEKECSEARSTVLTMLLVYLFSSPYSPVVRMLVDKGRRGIGQQGIVRGRGLLSCSHKLFADLVRLPEPLSHELFH